MSRSPSPTRKPTQYVPITTSAPKFDEVGDTLATIITTAPFYRNTDPTGLPSIISAIQHGRPSTSQFNSPRRATAVLLPPPQYLPRASESSNESHTPLHRADTVPSAVISPQPIAGLARSDSTRSAQRPKTHVPNACNNCKRAHLSCDVARPCSRCVQTGRMDSCRDVPHKKRGRPRLRDEIDFKVQQLGFMAHMDGRGGLAISTASGAMTSDREQRAGSFRTLRSNPDPPGGLPVSRAASRPMLGPPFAPRPWNTTIGPGFVTPIAFLDLDLTLLKVNSAFQTLIGHREMRNTPLMEIARPSDNNGLQVARNVLRAEREAKEPAYLPPIFRPGLDPASGITENDIEEVTRRFDDHRFKWIFLLAGGIERSLDIRLRLGKTSHYFVVLFLPPLQQSQEEHLLAGNPPPRPPWVHRSSTGAATDHASRHEPRPLLNYQSQHIQAEPVLASHWASESHAVLGERHQYRVSPPRAQPLQQQAYHTIQPPPHPRRHPTQYYPPVTSSAFAGASFATSPSYPQSSFDRPRSDTMDSLNAATRSRPRSEALESLGSHIQTRLQANNDVTTTLTAAGISASSSSQDIPRQSRSSSESRGSGRGEGRRSRKRTRMDLGQRL